MHKLIPEFNKTITILNKLKSIDNVDKIDKWKATVLNNCYLQKVTTRNSSESGEIIIAESYICKIPENDDYKPYNEWKDNLEGFTINPGDYIIDGILQEEVDANNILQVLKNYEKMVVSSFKDNTNSQLLKHYKIEGV